MQAANSVVVVFKKMFWFFALAVSSATAASPGLWPEYFTQSFLTVSANGVLQPGLLSYVYDDALQAQRIDHLKGGFECQHFYNTDGACSLVFLPRGMAALFPNGSCCWDLPGIGAPPRDWLANATYLGIENNQVSREVG